MNITGSLNTSLFALVSMLFITPIGEEIIFRGILPDLLNPQKTKTKLSFAAVLLIASLIWAAVHLHGMYTGGLVVLLLSIPYDI
jgi:membrane protease YdiL (CAAX protease family)